MDEKEVTVMQINKALADIEKVVKKHMMENLDGEVYFASIIIGLINQYMNIECTISKLTRKESFDQFCRRTELVLIQNKDLLFAKPFPLVKNED